MTNATAKSFLLTILQRDAADADPTADARTVAALVEREAATVRALREAEGLRHLVLVSVGDERLREVSRMPLWGEEAARAAEAKFVRAAAAADAVIAEPHRANPLAWRLHDKEGSDDVTGPIRWSGVTLRDAAWMGDFREGPVLHWRSNFRRELWSTPERLRRGPGVAAALVFFMTVLLYMTNTAPSNIRTIDNTCEAAIPPSAFITSWSVLNPSIKNRPMPYPIRYIANISPSNFLCRL